MDTVLIIDSSYMAYRAFHSRGAMAFEDTGTGTVFGFLADVMTLLESFPGATCAFTFDIGISKRASMIEGYKSTRKLRHSKESEEEQQARRDMRRQVKLLYADYLPSAGFSNVFGTPGFEADDIIAQVAKSLPASVQGVIVSSDHDLYQCLRPNVFIWNPSSKSSYGVASLINEYGVTPRHWARVKAIAGCGTDDIPGVAGVADKTAAKYVRGELGEHTKAYQAIEDNQDLIAKNMPLVALPLAGTPEYPLVPDEVTREKWAALADSIGATSIRNMAPGALGATPKVNTRRVRRGPSFGV